MKRLGFLILLLLLFFSIRLNAVVRAVNSFDITLTAGQVYTEPLSSLFYTDIGQVKVIVRPDTLAYMQDNNLVIKASKSQGFDNLFLKAVNERGETAQTIISVFYKAKNKGYKFVYAGKSTDSVFVAGEFNGWNSTKDKLQFLNGQFEKVLDLVPGRYQYKFVVNGNWIADTANKNRVRNSFGGYNSLAIAGNPEGRISDFTTYDTGDRGKRITLVYQKNSFGQLAQAFVIFNNLLVRDTSILNDGNSRVFLTIQLPVIPVKSILKVFGVDTAGRISKVEKFVLNDSSAFVWQDAVIYFAMTDRFFNGDKSNDTPIKDPDLAKKANYMGGDWEGIIKKIDAGYFTDLGINVIWISPVNNNPSIAYRDALPPHRKFSGYHGYWPTSETKLEEHFGTPSKLKELMQDAHKHNIKIMLDLVAHHIVKNSELYKQHPDYFGSVYTAQGETNIRLFDKYPLTTWFDWFLPTFDFVHNKKAVDYMTDKAIYLVRTYDFDAFREDAVKHIPHNFWKELKRKLVEDIGLPDNRKILQIGETIDSRERIERYVNNDELDGQFDFPLYWSIRNVFAFGTGNFNDLNNELNASEQVYGDNPFMSDFLGNHDFPRFISYAAGQVSPNSNGKEIGWKNPPTVPGEDAYKKMYLAFSFILTQPRVPMIYYGDEIGMPGAGDPDNRRMMKFKNLAKVQVDLKRKVTRLLKMREQNRALRYGKRTTLSVGPDYYVYADYYFKNIIITALNRADSPKAVGITIPSYMYAHSKYISLIDGTKYSAGGDTGGKQLNIIIPAQSSLFLKGL